jgi:hypothetical protein
MSGYQTNPRWLIDWNRWRVATCCLLLAICFHSRHGTRTAYSQVRAAESLQSGRSVQFSDHLIMAGYAYPYGIGLGDLDGDKDLDITSADATPHNKHFVSCSQVAKFKSCRHSQSIAVTAPLGISAQFQ